tara:strand:+ start:3810 stop:4385 length:576 start_codon:yes stop_codon:yes gene_type:complete
MKVYTNYFQKSKVFLYPLLNVKNGIIKVPIQTYIAWDSVYTPEDNKFLCEYKTKKTNDFEKFAYNNLLNNSHFESRIDINEDKQLFIYDFSEHKSDVKKFLKGEYSKFTLDNKIKILNFFSSQKKAGNFIKGFLDPEDVHENYALLLDVDVECIEDIYEVCTPPDILKETLLNNNCDIVEILNNNSIHLTK